MAFWLLMAISCVRFAIHFEGISIGPNVLRLQQSLRFLNIGKQIQFEALEDVSHEEHWEPQSKNCMFSWETTCSLKHRKTCHFVAMPPHHLGDNSALAIPLHALVDPMLQLHRWVSWNIRGTPQKVTNTTVTFVNHLKRVDEKGVSYDELCYRFDIIGYSGLLPRCCCKDCMITWCSSRIAEFIHSEPWSKCRIMFSQKNSPSNCWNILDAIGC